MQFKAPSGRQPDWQTLPSELLSLIHTHCSSDSAQLFRLVCTSWASAAPPMPASLTCTRDLLIAQAAFLGKLPSLTQLRLLKGACIHAVSKITQLTALTVNKKLDKFVYDYEKNEERTLEFNLQPLSSLTLLQKLNLDGYSGKADLRPLTALSRLDSLRIRDLQVSSLSVLQPLPALTELKLLRVANFDNYNDPFTNEVGALTNLQRLRIEWERGEFYHEGFWWCPLEGICCLSALTSLHLGADSYEPSLAVLSCLTSLRHLAIYLEDNRRMQFEIPYRKRGSTYANWLQHLASLQHLSSLVLGGHLSCISGISVLSSLKKLVLELKSTVRRLDVTSLNALPHLEMLVVPSFDSHPWVDQLQSVGMRAELSCAGDFIAFPCHQSYEHIEIEADNSNSSDGSEADPSDSSEPEGSE